MKTIAARNVNDAYPIGLMLLREQGVPRDSRNGPVLEMSDPVSLKYLAPTERVLFDRTRDINPFLHFFEPLWILAGRNDVEFLANIVPRFRDYSDDGKAFFGAYGHRLRYPEDQITKAIKILSNNPDDRRVVLQIRTPSDMWYKGLDTPCNTAIACKIRDGKLNIHVFNRSNDYIWGMTGANMPQFSVIQEYMAGNIGVQVGTYHQTTDSMHVYTELNDKWTTCKDTSIHVADPYVTCHVKPYPMFNGLNKEMSHLFDTDLMNFFENTDTTRFSTPFFKQVVAPMWKTFEAHKKERRGLDYVDYIEASDWRMVTVEWLKVRYAKRSNG